MKKLAKSQKVILFTGGLILIAIAVKWLFDTFKQPAKSVPATPPVTTGGVAIVGTVTPPTIKIQQLEIEEEGQTTFEVTGFPDGANLASFDLILNGQPMVNKAVVLIGNPYEYQITDLGGGNYRVEITTELIVINPELHTLVLKLNN
ncbi:hypothetical protein [Emticicia sp. BO119]|uniref:hypothetical protein n=1 Tax=Emticicia sp. BO119 TaxID=2757768 RepID=UPI0015F0B69A|nr:hypothetical protein [Emticicia sp. BO119]MBA4849027.1 hypothetical protein [Emticicia sp. BO119]